MNTQATFFINENMRLKSKYFELSLQKVDYETLLLESQFPNSHRDIYFKSGICAVILEFDVKSMQIFYTDKTQWNNKLLQSWLRKNLKKKIIEVAERVLPARLHYWENEKHLKAKGVNVRNLRKRTLGQCSANNYITLSPKILLMPEKLMDSVILHEMAHLVHHHHRKAFWQFLSVLLGEDAYEQHLKLSLEMGSKFQYIDFLMK